MSVMEELSNLESECTESQHIAEILTRYGEEHGFDTETCDEIASMDFPDAFETAFGYLAQAGLDPEEVLASFIEPPEE